MVAGALIRPSPTHRIGPIPDTAHPPFDHAPLRVVQVDRLRPLQRSLQEQQHRAGFVQVRRGLWLPRRRGVVRESFGEGVNPLIRKIREALEFTKDLVEKGKFVPVIDRTYPLEKIAEAFTYVASGQKIGNVIIKMDD